MATPAEIISTAQCFNCNGATLFESMQISILRNILEASDSPMTQDEINTQAACFVCLGMSLAQAQILVLLNAVAAATSGGGGGATGGAIVGSGSPEGVVAGNPGALYVDITNHAFYIKETGSGNMTFWQQYV